MSDPENPLDVWVGKHLTYMRAAPRQRRTMIGPAGTFRPLDDGEAVIVSPDGTPIRIVERIGDDGVVSGNQIEHGDVLHAVVRPQSIRMQFRMQPVTARSTPDD